MLNPNEKLSIPIDEKTFILPDARIKFFNHLMNEYKTRYPSFTLKYAYLNFDPECRLDYVLIYQTLSRDRTFDAIIFDVPMIYSNRSLPGYRYCIKNNLLGDFFEEATAMMAEMPAVRFVEYLNVMLNLSIDKNDSRFWKKPEFAKELCEGLLDLALRYNKK